MWKMLIDGQVFKSTTTVTRVELNANWSIVKRFRKLCVNPCKLIFCRQYLLVHKMVQKKVQYGRESASEAVRNSG